MSGNTEAELEHFRQKWRDEVTARTKNKTEDQAQRQREWRQQKQNQQEQQQRSKNPDDVSKAPTNRPAGITTDLQVAKASTSLTTTVNTSEVRKQYVGSNTASGTFDDDVSEVCMIDGDETAGGETSYRRPSSKSGRTLLAGNSPENAREPRSALEHYECAVEKECVGRLGESVNLYRKAFKLDDAVHETYKNKYFPPPTTATSESTAKSATGTKPAQLNPSNASETVPNTAHHSLDGLSRSLSELLSAFAGLSIEGATTRADQKISLQPSSTPKSPVSEPSLPLLTSSTSSAVEALEKLPCPIATLPEELLVEILNQVAVQDVGNFARLALVCRRLAYVITTEERVWKRVALGHEYGFAGMHYRYSCDLDGKPLRYDYGDDENSHGGGRVLSDDDGMDGISNSIMFTGAMHEHRMDPATIFSLSPTYPTYRQMFRLRPRIRFNGLYISTVNYSRPGAPSTSQLTWNSPVLIVTYYRYLRFYRDGTVISLLTITDPSEVVPVFHRENIPVNYHKHKSQHRQHHQQKLHSSHQGNSTASTASAPASAPAQLPSSIMKDTLRGRWHLSGLENMFGQTDPNLYDNKATELNEGILHVETEGVIPKYTWNMRFALASAGRAGARNNKLTWIDYRCYNRLADDWGDFGLKNDRPFYWSRVRSYGSGL